MARVGAGAGLAVTQLSLDRCSAAGAEFSPCRRWRYQLWREWQAGPRCVFIGLNPSTADEAEDDPTIRKCIGFAKRWGFGSLTMLNLFGHRSTDPAGLLTVPDPGGPGNRDAMQLAIDRASRVVLAWGSHSLKVRALVRPLVEVHGTSALPWGLIAPPTADVGILGRNADGSPRHPLMLAYATPFESVRLVQP